MKRLKIMITLITLMAFISCSHENEPTTTQSKKNPIGPFNVETMTNPITNDVINSYDRNDLVGVVFLENYKYDIENNGINIQTDRTDAYAFIVNNDRTATIDIGSNVIVNASALVHDISGNYKLVSDGSTFEANFGSGENIFLIEGSANFPEISGTASFATPINITNISYNQNISKSEDLLINWTGGKANELVQFYMIRTDTSIFGINAGTYKSVSSGNSLTIPSAQLTYGLANNGKYALKVMSYDPHYFTMTNGKKICFMGLTKHEITVNVVD